ncbi:hypothetical protein B9W64_37735 [Streptomyces sp. CS159]|uniref:hypothetical protein n=1 Tax=Streptomyces sp. CS159 TaxID=1982762 RepID=UPI000B41C0E3|nr:hypothetical protein [Streptomyces sp. CS159]OVZ99537.1 hypothetical protein B9W64_37735 [Streptomyces sp. CS159]
MSTPAPAPAPEDPSAPFDPHAFPAALVAAQRQAAELYAALHALQATLPWSREPHPGWPDETERGRERPGRPASPGWPADAAAEFDRLLEELRAATAVVQCHKWWERCEAEGIRGADMVAARQALKRAEGAVPLVREDVDAAA